MLRKIEFKLDYLVEAREYIQNSDKRKDLDAKEQKLHQDRREERIQNKKLEEKRLQEERKEKNMARIRKQDEFKIFKGKKQPFRSNKIKLKQEEEDHQEVNEEVLDQMRYLGTIL